MAYVFKGYGPLAMVHQSLHQINHTSLWEAARHFVVPSTHKSRLCETPITVMQHYPKKCRKMRCCCLPSYTPKSLSSAPICRSVARWGFRSESSPGVPRVYSGTCLHRKHASYHWAAAPHLWQRNSFAVLLWQCWAKSCCSCSVEMPAWLQTAKRSL